MSPFPRLWFLPLFVFALISPKIGAQNRLAQAPLYSLGTGTSSAVASDFNGDGRTDIVAFNLAFPGPSSTVTVTLANSNGSYGTPKVIASFASNMSGKVAAGDFNGDGKIDFAVALYIQGASTGSINVYLGNGDASFQTPKTTSFTGGQILSFLAAKITSSSHSDLVLGLAVNNSTAGSVWEYPGNGNGTFAAPKKSAVVSSFFQMTLGDVNQDGKQDVAVIGQHDYQILLGRGDGTFIIKPDVTTSSGLFEGGVVADYDNDGISDLIIANQGNIVAYPGTGEISSLFVLSGYGDGTFKTGTPVDAGNSGYGVALADFTRDGRPDLVVYNGLSSDIAIKIDSSTNGLKNAPLRYAVGVENSTFVALLSGDVNGDGKRDILFVGAAGVHVLLGIGAGHMAAPSATEIQSYSVDLKATDLNHDGFADLVIRGLNNGTQSRTENLYLALGNSTQSLAKKPSILKDTSGGGLGPLGLARFNTDNNIDIVTRDGVMFNNGSAVFTAPASGPLQIGITPRPVPDYSMAAGDLNGDGKADMVSMDEVFLYVWIGNGDGTFTQTTSYYLGGVKGETVLLRDLNGDGKLDAITSNADPASVSVYLGNGDGTFQAAHNFAAPSSFLAIGDFNVDGKLDIAAATRTTATILLGDGTGGFTVSSTFPLGSYIQGIATASLRGNGVYDLLAVDNEANTMRLFYSNRDGTFGSPVVYDLGIFPISIATGDFNGDGAQDVAVALNNSTGVPVFYNQGGTQFTLTASSTTPAAGQLVTFTAALTATMGNGTPGGTLSFKEGSTTYATTTFSGSATWGTPALSKGTHTIYAVYSGNGTFNPHTSAAVTITVH
jgi:hypothetical protein